MVTPAEIERVAAAIKTCLDAFRDPVCYYVEGEARRRWEAKNPDADWDDTPQSNDPLIDYKIIAEAALSRPWQPIETEPKDDTQRLVTDDPADPEAAHLVMLTPDGKHTNGDVVVESMGYEPTHWCAVPRG